MRFSLRSKFTVLFAAIFGFAVSVEIARAQTAGQIDPSSALLLNPGTSSTPVPPASRGTDPRLESGRYTVRPRAEKSRRTGEPVIVTVPGSTQAPTSGTVAAPTAATSAGSPVQNTEPVVLAPTESGAVVLPGAIRDAGHEDAPPIEVVVEPVPKASEYPPHILEISLASAYLYENSESAYSYRQSTMGGPAYVATARVWLSPEFGMGGQYISTLAGQVGDRPTPATTSTVSASRNETAFGLYLKKVFALSNVVFGLELVDSQFKVANDTVSKIKTKSTGARVSVEGEFLSASTSSWLIGSSFTPKVQHEEGATSTDVRSGTGVTAYALGASVERRWKFDDANALFIRIEHKIERDLFSGVASKVDPLTGAAPQGVGVTVGTTLIQFGYNWGN